LGGGPYVHPSGYYIDVTVTNSTITGNTATSRGGGVLDNADYGSLELNGVILSGNSAPAAREAYVSSRVDLTVGNFNIFGFSGSSGIEGFNPDVTDIVPTQPLGAILNT